MAKKTEKQSETKAKSAKSSKSTEARGGAKKSTAKQATSKQASSAKGAKSAVKPAPSATEGLNEQQRALIEKIEDALPELDVETLALVLRNTQVAIYNRQMEDTRRQVEEAQRAVEEDRVPGQAQAPGVDVEQISDQSFVIVYGPERIFFNRAELREIARICWAAEDEKSGATRLFKWFERERRDFLLDTGVTSPSDTGLKELWSLVRSRYKVS